MKLSTTNGIIRDTYEKHPLEAFDRCFALLKQAGYDRVDLSFWGVSIPGGWFDRPDWTDTVSAIGELTQKHGLPVYQTHGNTHSGKEWDDPDYPLHDFQLKSNLRAIRGTAMLGGKWIVIHPMNLPHDPLYSPAKAKEANLRYLAPLIEEAKKWGVGLAVENMVDFRGRRRRYCGGNIYELIDLVDTIHDPSVGICLDTGHANLDGVESAAAIREIGSRLKALHINDNHAGEADEHLFPYFGTVNWTDTVRALKGIGYEGDFAYEAGSQRIPYELYPEWLRYTAALGRHLMNLK